jgi:hypothetical protein
MGSWFFRTALCQPLSKVPHIVVGDGFREEQEEHRCRGATDYHKRAAGFHAPHCRKGCIPREVLQVGEEDTAGNHQLGAHCSLVNAGLVHRRIGLRGF